MFIYIAFVLTRYIVDKQNPYLIRDTDIELLITLFQLCTLASRTDKLEISIFKGGKLKSYP